MVVSGESIACKDQLSLATSLSLRGHDHFVWLDIKDLLMFGSKKQTGPSEMRLRVPLATSDEHHEELDLQQNSRWNSQWSKFFSQLFLILIPYVFISSSNSLSLECSLSCMKLSLLQLALPSLPVFAGKWLNIVPGLK